MQVTFNSVGFLTHYKHNLSVSFESYQAVDYVAACLFQTSCPNNIVLFIKASFQFHQNRYLLTVFRCFRQSCYDGRVTAHTVQGLFNRQNLGVIGSIVYQFHYGVKTFIRVVQKNISLADCFKQILVLRKFRRLLRFERLVKPRPHSGKTCKFKEASCIQGSIGFVNFHGTYVQVFFQELFNTTVISLVNFQTHRSTTLTFAQRFFYLFQQIVNIVFIHVQIGVTCYPKGNHIQNLTAIKQISAMTGNNIFQENEGTLCFAGNFCNTVKHGRNLYQAHAVLTFVIDKLHCQIQSSICQERERSRSIHRHRS